MGTLKLRVFKKWSIIRGKIIINLKSGDLIKGKILMKNSENFVYFNYFKFQIVCPMPLY
jgi:hypothetical protein